MLNDLSRFALPGSLLLLNLAACSSNYRREPSDPTTTTATDTSTSAGGTSTSAGGTSTVTTGTQSSTGGGGTGGVTTTGTMSTTGGTVSHCDSASPDCMCDSAGCFLVEGASCTQAADCKTQVCGVTQEANNVCCAQACDEDQVCLSDGSGCEPATACEESLERCSAEGNHERCTEGQWETVSECGGLGCSLELTSGCLHALGAACDADDECGAGTCLETTDGSAVCCDASCGPCQVCNQAGTDCADPDEVKPDCECTASDTSNCDDDIPCTDDTCEDGVCSNDLQSGYCLIEGQCLDHNQQEAGNPCRYCDASVRDRAWTSSANTVSCDDGLWCTGADTCNGSGQCQHQFPTSNRCTESGDCALTNCDEDRDSCYEPSSTVCDTRTELRCDPGNACGADVQSHTITTKCSGSSAGCDGDESTSSWAPSTACGSTKKCDPESFTCKGALNCGDSWCDPDSGLCWISFESEPDPMDKADAIAYCNALDHAGRGPGSWRLPEINEWLGVARGCDEATGWVQTEDFPSTCEWDGSATITPCEGSCPDGDGPGNGCYWPSAMGQCASVGYWSSSEGAGTYFFEARTNWAVSLSDASLQAVRCVTEE